MRRPALVAVVGAAALAAAASPRVATGQAAADAIPCVTAAPSEATAVVDVFVVDAPNAHTVAPVEVPDGAHARLYAQTYLHWKTDVEDGRQDFRKNGVEIPGVFCVEVRGGRAFLPLRTGWTPVDEWGWESVLTLVMTDRSGDAIAARWTMQTYRHSASDQELLDYQQVFVYPSLTHWSEAEKSRDFEAARDVQAYALQRALAHRSQLLQSFLPTVDRSRIPLLLVHGIHGNAGYFGDLRRVLMDRGFDVWEILYPNNQNIRFSAGLLGHAIRWIGRFYDRPQVDVVAHSMGGLVSRAYVEGLGLLASDETAHAPGDRAVPYRGEVRKWMSFGTPNFGQMWSHALTGSSFDPGCSAETAIARKIRDASPGNIPFVNEEPALLQLAAGSAFLWRLNEVPLPADVHAVDNWLTVTGHSPESGLLDRLTMGCLAFDPLNDNVVDALAGHLSTEHIPFGEVELRRDLLQPLKSVHELLASDTKMIPDVVTSFVRSTTPGARPAALSGLPQRVIPVDHDGQFLAPVNLAGLNVRYVDVVSPGPGATLGEGAIGPTVGVSALVVNDNRGARTVAGGFPVGYAITRWAQTPSAPAAGDPALRFPGVMRDVQTPLTIQVPSGPRLDLVADTIRQVAVCRDSRPLGLTSRDALKVTAVQSDAIQIVWHTNRPAWATVRYVGGDGVPNDVTLPEESADRTAILPDLAPGDTVEVEVVLHDPCQGAPIPWTQTIRLSTTSPGGDPGQTVGSSTVLVLDASGSMNTDDADGRTRWDAAVGAAGRLLHMIGRENAVAGTHHVVGAVTFDDDASTLSTLVDDTDAVAVALASTGPSGNTFMATGIRAALDVMSTGSVGRRIVVLLSDGAAHDEDDVRALMPRLSSAADCMYTIGFGSAGPASLFNLFGSAREVNEPFLRELAATTTCGAYYPAASAADLEHAYVRLRHEATGVIVGEATGSIGPGETTPPTAFDVSPTAGQLHVTLDWPGSAVDLFLQDPTGRRVDPGYPGATVDANGPPVYVIIDQPMPGRWLMSAFGRDLPNGPESYSLVGSTRGVRTAGMMPSPSSGGAGPVLALAALLVGGVLLATKPRTDAASQKRAEASTAEPAWPLVFLVDDGGPSQTTCAVSRWPWRIGRSPQADLVLRDPMISRLHCIIALDRRGRWLVTDEKSTAGTVLNGRPIQVAALRPGDELRIGPVRLKVIDPQRFRAKPGGARSAAPPGG